MHLRACCGDAPDGHSDPVQRPLFSALAPCLSPADLGLGHGFSQTLQAGANQEVRRQPGPPFTGPLFFQPQHCLRELAGGSLPLNIQARPHAKEK